MKFMRRTKRVRTAPRIDKSELAYPVRPRFRVAKYLKSFCHRSCISCGTDQGVIPAHIRHGLAGGTALKPDDTLVMPLCDTCHRLQGKNEVLFWLMAKQWTIEQAKQEAAVLYLEWGWEKEAPAMATKQALQVVNLPHNKISD